MISFTFIAELPSPADHGFKEAEACPKTKGVSRVLTDFELGAILSEFF